LNRNSERIPGSSLLRGSSIPWLYLIHIEETRNPGKLDLRQASRNALPISFQVAYNLGQPAFGILDGYSRTQVVGYDAPDLASC
jgi:hypothetical protein